MDREETDFEPCHVENRPFMFEKVSRFCLTAGRDLVNAHFLVPAGNGQEVLLIGRIRVERQRSDTVFWKNRDSHIVLQVADCAGRRRSCTAE